MVLQATLLCLVLVSSSPIAGGTVFTPEQTTLLQEFVETLMQCRGITGLTLAVVRGNDTWTKGFGVADKESGRNVSSSTLFGIGSVTKAFTSAILSLFINETGRYSWETPVVDILGQDFRFADDQLTRDVTLKDLLTHRTGLSTTNIPLYAGSPPGLTRALFADRLRYLSVSSLFRDEFDYNNWMYGLAGRVAEVMGGASWEELLQTRLFRPLGMSDSRVLGQTVTVEAGNFAKPYIQTGSDVVPSDPAIYRISPQEPAGAIASSADDMAKWLLLHVSKGKTPGGAVLLNETRMREMFSPHISLPNSFSSLFNVWKPDFPVTFDTHSYGYGWMLGTYRGYPVTWHSGGFFAYITYIALLPTADLGVFLSTNGPGGRNASTVNRQIFSFIADLGLGREPWQNLTNACGYPEPWINASAAEEDELRNNSTQVLDGGFDNPHRFVGVYGHQLFGDVEVATNGTDGLRMQYNRLAGRLHRTADEGVVMVDLLGGMSFLSRAVNATKYIRLNFTRPSVTGVYGRLEVSAPDLGETDILVFRRDIRFSDPVTDSGSDVACAGRNDCVVLCLIVSALTLTGWCGNFL